MRFSLFPVLSAIALALGLSACASYPPMVPRASFVDTVDVELRQEVTSPTIAQMVAAKTRREATRYGRSGEPKRLRVAITGLHYKNALMSMVVGDANKLSAHVTVADVFSGKGHGEFDTVVIDSVALNGVAGVIVSAMQDKAEVDHRLSDRLAADIMARVYGSDVAKEASRRPAVEAPEATPAAAPVDPARPKPAPANVREPKTAMADGAAVAR